jgi:hypothetical protein
MHISIFLNNALKPTAVPAEIDSDAPLPGTIREMPEQVGGRFVDLGPETSHDIEAAWKRVMILNDTQVLYTFSFDPLTMKFAARKR